MDGELENCLQGSGRDVFEILSRYLCGRIEENLRPEYKCMLPLQGPILAFPLSPRLFLRSKQVDR
jgi:hypothetical protein